MEIWGGNRAADNSISTPGLDLWVSSQPYHQAESGGDVHYVSLCGGGIITRFILADVSGHGASVADLARALRDLMRRNINRKSQARLVKELNRRFTELAHLSRFATAVLGTYLTTTDQLTLCNAGHPRPFWYRAATREWSVLPDAREPAGAGLANLPLGIDDSTIYPQVVLGLEPGDFVLIYTDALTECTDDQGGQLGEHGLLSLVRALDVTDPLRIAPAVLVALDRFRGGRPVEDDQTFLLLHHNGAPSRRLTLGEKMDVYAKVFGLKRY
jgi:serine phosphatase RsbU (regulator of sigma subunit)